jgi:hypothetical protein
MVSGVLVLTLGYCRVEVDTVLGLGGLVVFICCVIALAAAVTWAVVRILPAREPEKKQAAS